MVNETPMLFPMAPGEFWKQIRSTIEEVVKANNNQAAVPPPTDHLPEKALLKASDVCAVFQVSKPTLYEWLRQNKLKSFKIKSRRYFLRTDIEAMIRNHEDVELKGKAI
jgi:predicted DNA-binding transcriptional regulator AlpA